MKDEHNGDGGVGCGVVMLLVLIMASNFFNFKMFDKMEARINKLEQTIEAKSK